MESHSPTICLSVFDHFVGLALKGLSYLCYSTSFKYGWISKKVSIFSSMIHEHIARYTDILLAKGKFSPNKISVFYPFFVELIGSFHGLINGVRLFFELLIQWYVLELYKEKSPGFRVTFFKNSDNFLLLWDNANIHL